MKKFYLALVALVCLSCAAAVAQESTTWFDLHNCGICKNLTQVEDLLPNIEWENHVIPQGMLSISVVPDAYKEKMEAAHKGMEATVERLKSGEAMHLCGFCQSYGALMNAGAESTELETAGGKISLITSDDPGVVEKIHAHAKTTIEEFKKMKAHHAEHGAHGHHEHGEHSHHEHGEHSHDHDHEGAHDSDG